MRSGEPSSSQLAAKVDAALLALRRLTSAVMTHKREKSLVDAHIAETKLYQEVGN